MSHKGIRCIVMSHKGIRCVVMSHKGVWSEACGIV